jgi:CHASE3 domain sensor protein
LERRKKKPRPVGIFNRSVAAIAALAFSVFLLVGLGILISVNVATLRSRISWTQHTNDVLLKIVSVQQNLVRMESNIRAYGLTQDRRHVSAWGNITKRTRTGLNELGVLVSDNPDQLRRLTALRPKIEDRIGRWSRVVDTGMRNDNATITQDMRDLLARDMSIIRCAPLGPG